MIRGGGGAVCLVSGGYAIAYLSHAHRGFYPSTYLQEYFT